jgi:AcrR family transcriptional regulator
LRVSERDEETAVKPDADALSHNLLGQRLGRKGRDTRERIIAATDRLIAGSADTPISLSAVAREASLGMTTLYLYFTDLTELLLAVLDPVFASAEESYIGQLRTHWPDDELDAHCLQFVQAYLQFWERHSRILHLRNSLADNGDQRMRHHRIAAVQPLRTTLLEQMNVSPGETSESIGALATVLITAVERTITMATDASISSLRAHDYTGYVAEASARVLALGVREGRRMSQAAAR